MVVQEEDLLLVVVALVAVLLGAAVLVVVQALVLLLLGHSLAKDMECSMSSANECSPPSAKGECSLSVLPVLGQAVLHGIVLLLGDTVLSIYFYSLAPANLGRGCPLVFVLSLLSAPHRVRLRRRCRPYCPPRPHVSGE